MGFSRQEYWSGVPLPSLAVILEPPKIKSVTVSTVSLQSWIGILATVAENPVATIPNTQVDALGPLA